MAIVKPPQLLLVRRDWRGQDCIPRSGGVIVAANHLAHVDPLTLAHFVYEAGRLPRYLAKAELFDVPVLGRLLRAGGQIPIRRAGRDSTRGLDEALAALNRGECLVIYPEGTITRDPRGWPMTGRTGAARLALLSGAPVIPVAQWGAQEILPAYSKRLRLLPRKLVRMLAGPAVDLSRWKGRPLTSEVLREATDEIMARIRDQLGVLRGEPVPQDVFDPRQRKGLG